MGLEMGVIGGGNEPIGNTVEDELYRAALLTTMMRQHQESVIRLGGQRREIIRSLREKRVPYRKIADICGVTDQALFADLRKHKN